MKKKSSQWKFIIIVSVVTAAISTIVISFKNEILRVFKRNKIIG